MINLHYHPVTGEIVAWDNSEIPQAIPGCAITSVVSHITAVSLKEQKIDVKTGELVKRSPSEQAFYHLPAEHEVRAARYAELVATDWAANARHLSEDEQGEWEKYRQTLRDLGEHTNPVEMIEAWPTRPDGADAIPFLRKRI